MKKLLTILLLTSTIAIADPPDHANNPDPEDMPDNANCSFCNDDEPPAPIPYELGAVFGAIALGLCLCKNKKV